MPSRRVPVRRARTGQRLLHVVVAVALTTSMAACAGDDDTTPSESATAGASTTVAPVDTTEATESTGVVADPIDTTAATETTETPVGPDDTEPDGPIGDEEGPPLPDPSELPEAPAPPGLDASPLPADGAGVVTLFDELPDELLGGVLNLDAIPGRVLALYETGERSCAQIGFQAFELGLDGAMYPPEWRAEQFVALFASGADWDVEEAGRDGERYWVSWETSCGEAGVPGSEAIFSATWGDLGSTWAYSVAAHDVVGRAELLAAFAVAAATTGPAEPPSDEQLAAEAALLTLDDLVGDWVPVVRIPSDDAGFDELATPVLRAESTCAAAVAWADREGLTVSGLVDALMPDAVARAESPTFTSMRDGSEIEHAVSVWANPAVVAESFATARDVDWMACLVSAFGELMVARLAADGIEVEIVDYSASALAPQLGDDALGARFEMTAEAQGEQVTIVSSLAVVAIGEVTSAVSFFAVGGDASFDVDALAAVAADRVAEVFGVDD